MMPSDGTHEDTICAIATPPGEGGIGIVRISGPSAVAVAQKLVRLRSQQPLEAAPAYTLHLADILAPSASSPSLDSALIGSPWSERIIDEGLVVYMQAPRSFTAEDVVEIHCHGSMMILHLLCDACVAVGARLAQPGEFTKRAFLNGRMDLSQAEAVFDTIKATSELGLKQAQRQLRGELRGRIDQLRTRLIGLLAHVEAGIDFVEEDIVFVGRNDVIAALQEVLHQIEQWLMTAEHARVLREGVRVVISGRPNVGKSSLFNRLLREDRAIVTDIPGTTRDVIEESVRWDGLHVTLVDTAGLRGTMDVIEQEGIRRSKLAQDHGDIVLHVLDASDPDHTYLEELGDQTMVRTSLILVNKCDLVGHELTRQLCETIQARTGCITLPISVRSGLGLAAVPPAIRSHVSQRSLEPLEGVAVTNLRHRAALERTRTSLVEALTSCRNGLEPEFVAMDLRGAADSLGEITGVITSDDILNQIFSEFCIGK